MPYLFREIVFCECGRPALPGGCECRTCYEDFWRRKWREAFRNEAPLGVAEPRRLVNARRRELFAPGTTEEDVERNFVLVGRDGGFSRPIATSRVD